MDKSNDKSIQGTNDSSVISKWSTCNAGYFCDDFLQYFISKPCRRAPLINWGYYIRAKTIDFALTTFLNYNKGKKIQIISLGAGFDSSFFRMHSQNLLEDCTFYEVDYEVVMKRKKALIDQEFNLFNLLEHSESEIEIFEPIILNSKKYKLLGCDLNRIDLLESSLRFLGFNEKCPTLILSEVVLTYMGYKKSSALLKWILSTITNGFLVVYEQIEPNDAFGIIMKNHFKKIGSPLLSIDRVKNAGQQASRLIDMGWRKATAINMNDFYAKMINDTEKERIRQLDLFDEFEEWHLKCQHYSLLLAGQGSSENLVTLFPNCNYSNQANCNIFQWGNSDETLTIDSKFSKISQRYAFCTFIENSTNFILFGGFGRKDRIQSRLHGIERCNVENGVVTTCEVIGDPSDVEYLFSTCCLLSKDEAFVFGGRLSPKKANKDLISLSVTDEGLLIEKIHSQGKQPSARWRHAMCCINYDEKVCLFLHGGRIDGSVVFSDAYIYGVNSKIWSRVANSPIACHSHASVYCNDSCSIYISGGLDSQLKPLSCIQRLNLKTMTWELLTTALIPRYSHTCHLVHSKLLLVGGVTWQTPSSLYASIDLPTLEISEYFMPDAEPDKLFLMHNHASFLLKESKFIVDGKDVPDEILIIGGGGNCFSFGTHLNSMAIRFKVNLTKPDVC